MANRVPKAFMKTTSIREVRSFWEEEPLFKGESDFEPGTPPYFDEHRRVYIEDCFAGKGHPTPPRH